MLKWQIAESFCAAEDFKTTKNDMHTVFPFLIQLPSSSLFFTCLLQNLYSTFLVFFNLYTCKYDIQLDVEE